MHFEKKKVRLEEHISPQKALEYVKSPIGVWLDVVKESNEELREILSLLFPEYSALILEDCIEDTRPKIERYKDFTFMVIKTVPEKNFDYSQMNIIIGKDFVLTIRRGFTDVGHIKKFFTRNEKFSVDFVLYKLLEHTLNKYLLLLDAVEDDLERFERIALAKPKTTNLADMMHLKRQLFKLHKILAAQREIIAILFRGEIKYIKPKTMIYLRDAFDDIAKLIDIEETYRDMMTGLMDVHLSSMGAQTNEVVKLLTVVATFVLVPTLVSSIYSMNFAYMPMLDWKYGYEFALILMGASVFGTYLFFKKKGWIG